jgi:hypothetical protein
MGKTIKMSEMTKAVIAMGIIAIVIFIVLFVIPTANKFTTTTSGSDIGFNLAFNPNIGNDSCPVASVNDLTIAKAIKANNYRSYMPEEIVTLLAYDTAQPSPNQAYTCATKGVPADAKIPQDGTQAGFLKIMNDPSSSLQVALDLDYDLSTSIPDASGFCPGLLFAEALKKYPRITRLQVGLVSSKVSDIHSSTGSGGNLNPTETSLRTAIYTAMSGAEDHYVLTNRPYDPATGRAGPPSAPIPHGNNATDNIMIARLHQVFAMLQTIGRTDIELVIPAQGDTQVDDSNSTDPYAFGNIFGPPKAGAFDYTSGQYNTYKPWFDGLMNTIVALKKAGAKINYLASTLYPYYYVSKAAPSTWSQPEDYAGLLYQQKQYIAKINKKYGTALSYMVSETGWPSFCDHGAGGLGAEKIYPRLNPLRRRASPCHKCIMWKYFVNPGDSGYKSTVSVFGKSVSVPSNVGNGVPRYWWVLAGDATHVDCWANPEPAPGQTIDSSVYRANGWNMINSRGDFACPYPENIRTPGTGSKGGVLLNSKCEIGCPPGSPGRGYLPMCCKPGQNCTFLDPNTGREAPCCTPPPPPPGVAPPPPELVPPKLCSRYC